MMKSDAHGKTSK